MVKKILHGRKKLTIWHFGEADENLKKDLLSP
jgi:hypothetical protein